MHHIIKTITVDSDDYSIKITYSDNVIITAYFKGLIEKGLMLLLKNPEAFRQVQIGRKGLSIMWREYQIDFCADCLRSKYSQSESCCETGIKQVYPNL